MATQSYAVKTDHEAARVRSFAKNFWAFVADRCAIRGEVSHNIRGGASR